MYVDGPSQASTPQEESGESQAYRTARYGCNRALGVEPVHRHKGKGGDRNSCPSAQTRRSELRNAIATKDRLLADPRGKSHEQEEQLFCGGSG